MRWHVCTTIHQPGWEAYGRRMAQSFVDRWTSKATLTVYAEGFEPDVDGVEVRRLPAWLDEFKAQHAGNSARHGMTRTGYHYIYDAVRFSHKVAAMTDFGESLDGDVMVWLDADTFTHADVTSEWLRGLFPEPAYIAWLDRRNAHVETGLIFFRPAHPFHRLMMERMREYYVKGRIFDLPQHHDCAVIQDIVAKAFHNHSIPAAHSLSGRAVRTSHPLALGPCSKCLDHAKGPRKEKGRTPASERSWFVRDSNPYWAPDGLAGKILRLAE